MTKKIGFYAGSFDPFHVGHDDILGKSIQLFDKVILLVGQNPDKSNSTPVKDRVESLLATVSRKYGNIDVCGISKTLPETIVDFVSPLETPFLIRGLRNGYDLDYEMNQYEVLKLMMPRLQVVFVPCEKKYDHISSSMIRSLQKIDSDYARRVVKEYTDMFYFRRS